MPCLAEGDVTVDMLQRVPPDLLQKYQQFAVVNTQPHREMAVVEQLSRQGYEPYCPRVLRRTSHARRLRDILKPLFPGYVFVALDPAIQQWSPIGSTFGVRRIVKAGDRPALLDGGFIDALKARELEGAVVRPENPYEIGDSVQFVSNAFEGVVAKIVALKDADRIVVMLELLHRPVAFTTDVRAVRPLAP